MPSHRPEGIANAFLKKAKQSGISVTQMKLQKLVYIAHGWTLALSAKPLVNQEPEAWDRGPVFPELRDYAKNSGSKPIVDLIHENDKSPFVFFGNQPRGDIITADLNNYEQQVIDHVWSRYGQLSAFRLSDLTHMPNTPWSKTYKNGFGRNDSIDNALIKEYYGQLVQRSKATQKR